ncbi:hypothetical protein A8M77_05290 [Variovorax sp. JS1663]|nr:hypothetical protein A8M77_05290 [Variovorax sp. JS1663]
MSTGGQSVATPGGGAQKAQDAAVTQGKPAEDASLCTVEIYGDSIMGFNGTATRPSMVLQLFRPNLLVVADHSIAGQSLADLATPFPYLTRSAHFVVIENGVIDAWQGKSINTVISDYYHIIQQLRAEGRVPVLTGFARQARGGELGQYSLLLRDYYDAVLRSIASNTGVPFADWGAVPFFGAWDLVDFVHPNKNYSDRLIAQLGLALDPLTTHCTNTLFLPEGAGLT